MIPITVGILQASGTPSAFKNFLLALSYTLGISTTFALLGFVAALGSCVFGEMQGSPWVVIPLATLLIYFGLSMFDWVHLYIPRFLQPKTGKVKGGSPLSAFIFGAISGTIASPCLSPGLVLILNYVTNSGAQHFTGYIEGFLASLYFWHWIKLATLNYWNIFEFTPYFTKSWDVDGRNKKNCGPDAYLHGLLSSFAS